MRVSATLRLIVLLGCVAVFTGCGATPKGQSEPTANSAGLAQAVSPEEARTIAENFADGFVLATMQPLDEMAVRTKRPEVADWALKQKIATAVSSYTIATEDNPYTACVDLIILSSLKRMAFEKHWVPDLLHEEGSALLETAKRSEAEAWEMANKILSQSQIDDLHNVLDTWLADHPDQYYVGWIRLTDIASARKLTRHSAQVKAPGNVFGLLYLDPLAGLDPVAQEVRSYRLLTERLTYLFMRMPVVYGWQVESTVSSVMNTAGPSQIVAATTKFSDATDRFADAASGYPKAFGDVMSRSLEKVNTTVADQRAAAFNDAERVLTVQREALTKTVDQQQEKVQAMLTQVRSVVADVDRTAQGAAKSTNETIAQADASAQRLIASARNAVIIIIIVACVVPAVVLLAYRSLAKPSRR